MLKSLLLITSLWHIYPTQNGLFIEAHAESAIESVKHDGINVDAFRVLFNTYIVEKAPGCLVNPNSTENQLLREMIEMAKIQSDYYASRPVPEILFFRDHAAKLREIKGKYESEAYALAAGWLSLGAVAHWWPPLGGESQIDAGHALELGKSNPFTVYANADALSLIKERSWAIQKAVESYGRIKIKNEAEKAKLLIQHLVESQQMLPEIIALFEEVKLRI